MVKTVSILGATGSVGSSTLDLVEREPERFQVLALTANCDVDKLAAAAIRTNARIAVVADESCLPGLRDALAGTGIATAGGYRALLDAAAMGADWTMAAIVGCAGLEPVMAAIAQGGTVVLANKEPLVSAGEVILAAAAASGATLLPADSEHNAIFQCFDPARPERVRRIILTGSGGPFRDRSLAEMRDVTPEQAVAHPNWSMGAKISIDSATMMNKGLELIEAARLFPVPTSRIEIVIHRQSVIHSLVDYVDGSVLAQLGVTDMRVPIQYALSHPERWDSPVASLDFARTPALEFEAPDTERFPCLRLAYGALAKGGTFPAVLNAANEVAVQAFLEGRAAFPSISDCVGDVLAAFSGGPAGSLDDVLEADRWSRQRATEVLGRTAARAAS